MELKPGLRWLIYGRSGSGKTQEAIGVLSLYKRLETPPYIVLISPNAQNDDTWKAAQEEWKGMGMEELVDSHFHDYDNDVRSMLSSMLDRRNGMSEGDERDVLLMIDDLGEDHTLNRTYINNPVRQIAIRSRHLKITMIMLYQSVAETMPILSKNAEIIVAKRITDLVDLKSFHRRFMGDYTPDEFRRATTACWREPFDSMVIDRTGQETKLYRNFEEPVVIKEDTSLDLT